MYLVLEATILMHHDSHSSACGALSSSWDREIEVSFWLCSHFIEQYNSSISQCYQCVTCVHSLSFSIFSQSHLRFLIFHLFSCRTQMCSEIRQLHRVSYPILRPYFAADSPSEPACLLQLHTLSSMIQFRSFQRQSHLNYCMSFSKIMRYLFSSSSPGNYSPLSSNWEMSLYPSWIACLHPCLLIPCCFEAQVVETSS